MCATAALGDGATLQPGIDDHRDTVPAQLLGRPNARRTGGRSCLRRTAFKPMLPNKLRGVGMGMIVACSMASFGF
jgi:hypothetical protein